MSDRYYVYCLDCEYEKRCTDHGSLSAKTRAERSRSGHLNRESCSHVLVLSASEKALYDEGWMPAQHKDEIIDYFHDRLDDMETRINELEDQLA